MTSFKETYGYYCTGGQDANLGKRAVPYDGRNLFYKVYVHVNVIYS